MLSCTTRGRNYLGLFIDMRLECLLLTNIGLQMFIKVLLSAVIAADDKQGYQWHVSYVFLISDNQSFP